LLSTLAFGTAAVGQMKLRPKVVATVHRKLDHILGCSRILKEGGRKDRRFLETAQKRFRFDDPVGSKKSKQRNAEKGNTFIMNLLAFSGAE
jgi:hypothetical protein